MKKYKYLIIFLFSTVVSLCIFLLSSDFFLKKHTNHSQMIVVPNLLGKTFQEAHNLISDIKLNYKIIDGEIRDYNPKFKVSTVTSQNPLPFDTVKEGRSIYITINADNIPITSFPSISDQPFRYAKNILQSVNLKVGDIFYQNDIARNVVLKSEYNSFSINKKDSLPIFSTIDLYIGTGFPKNQFEYKVPKLKGLLLDEAYSVLKDNLLNLGNVYIDDYIEDTLSLFVYKQRQKYTGVSKIIYFSYKTKAPLIDLWLTNDTTKLIY